jgi:hypothetical protein
MSARSRLLVGAVFAAAVLCTAAAAQQVDIPVEPASPFIQLGTLVEQDALFQTQRGSKDQSQAGLAKQYVKAQKDDEKKEIRKKIVESLGKQFDQYVQQQQKELENLEKQIVTLKATLKKRADNKTNIIDRRVEQLILEAEGLGWNAPGSPRGPGFGGALVPPATRNIREDAAPDLPTAAKRR